MSGDNLSSEVSLKGFESDIYPCDKDQEIIDLVHPFHMENRKTYWYTMGTRRIEMQLESEGYFYPFDMSLTGKNYVSKLYIILKVPELRLKEEFSDLRMSWAHNLMHNLVKKAVPIINSMPRGPLDDIWLDINSAWFLKEGRRKKYLKEIGSTEDLEGLSGGLPEKDLILFLPFWFTADEVYNIPLHRCDKNKENGIRILYKLSIEKLLTIVDSTGNFVKFDRKYFSVFPESGKLEVPEMFCKYSKFQKETGDCEPERYLRYYDDILIRDFKEEVIPEEPLRIKINSNYVKCIFGCVENYSAKEKGILSNYSNDPSREGYLRGSSPLISIALESKEGGRKISPLAMIHFESASEEHFPSGPDEVGHFAIPFSLIPCVVNEVMPGVSLKDFDETLVFLFKKSQNKYKVHLRILTYNEFSL